MHVLNIEIKFIDEKWKAKKFSRKKARYLYTVNRKVASQIKSLGNRGSNFTNGYGRKNRTCLTKCFGIPANFA